MINFGTNDFRTRTFRGYLESNALILNYKIYTFYGCMRCNPGVYYD